MAAIFQIRRGTSDISLTEGELYLHQGSGSLQFGSGSAKYNVLTLDAPVKGNINLIGNISASGDVRIGGNIYLGDSAASDNISALGIFTTNLVPNGTIDLGTTTAKWNNVYGNSIWGAISASNGVISGSAQFTGVLSSLNDYTASQNTKNTTLASVTASFNLHTASINSFTSSQLAKDVIIGAYTSSMNTFTASVNGHISDINVKTGSFEAKNIIIAAYTASMNTFTASVNGHISDINTKTGSFETKWSTLQNVTSSILSYTSSLKSAIELTGSSVTILGNLVVKGTQLLVDSTTIQLGDNILELNGAAAANGGLLVKDTSGTSGSLVWDSTNDYWKGGAIGNEEKLLRAGSDGVISGSLSSLNTFTASVNGHIADINIKTGSLENKFSTLGLYTASIDTKFNTLQTLTASIDAQVTRIQESTASLNSYTASQDTKNSALAVYTASVSEHIVDINAKTGSFETKWSTLQSYTSSIDSKFSTLQSYTSSIDSKFSTLQTLTASVQSQIDRIHESTASLNTFSSSINAFYNNFTASLANGGFSASVDKRLDDVEYTITILDPGNIGDALLGINLVTSSLQVASASLQEFTASQEAKNTIIASYTSSMNAFTASVDNKFSTLQTLTASISSQILRIQESTASLNSFTSSINTTIKSKLDVDGVISGSSQLTSSLVQVSQTSSMTVLAAATVTVAASNTLNDSTLYPTFTNNIVNATTSLKSHPSGTFYYDGVSRKVYGEAFVGAIEATNGVVSGSSQVIDILSSLNSFTSSLDATYATEAEVAAGYESKGRGIVSGSSQITPLLPNGVVSGSSQVTGILSSLNSFTSSLDATYATEAEVAAGYEAKGRGIVSGSSQVSYTGLSNIPGGIVSGSSQILGGSNILSGSNQSNITSINQNLGTTSTGVQFASLGIGTAPDATYELKIDGDVAASGDIVAYYSSDERLKQNITPIENAVDKINQMGGYTFDWNEELQKARKGHDFGVIAQEVQSVLPEIVTERETGYLAVDYVKLVPVLIEAIKELSAKVDRLEKK